MICFLYGVSCCLSKTIVSEDVTMYFCTNYTLRNMKLIVPKLLLIITSFFWIFGSGQDDKTTFAAAEYLKQHPQNPKDYLISKFRKYPIVLLGEDHAVKENLDFVKNLIPELYNAGVYNLCMEFGAFEKQKELDELLTAQKFDERKAKDLMFFYNVGWAYKEYVDIYKAAWEFNKTLKPEARTFRIINLSYQYRWEHFKGGARTPENMKAVFNLGTPDHFRTEIIRKEIIGKNEKALVYMGHVHVFTKYKMPLLKVNNDDFCDYDNGMVGNRLYKLMPGKIFNIMFHTPMFSKTQYNPAYVSPADGELENALQKIGYPQIGFDLIDTPVGKLSDNSFFSLCHPAFKMEDFFDGYIFLKPFKDLTGCTYDDDFFTGKDWHYIENNFPDPDWRKPKNLEEYKTAIRKYVDIKDRYRDVIQVSIPEVSAGKIIRINQFSSKYVIPRNVDIWLPENYNPDKKYAVLYMHDGQMLFDPNINWNNSEWNVDENYTKLSKKIRLKDCIVVGLWNTGATRHSEYFPQKAFESLPTELKNSLLEKNLQGKIQSDNYLKFIVEELKPFIDKNFPTLGDKANTYIAGSSMGGLISMYAICEYPEVFGGAACLSTHWIGITERSDDIIPSAFQNYLKQNLPDHKTHRLYFDFGTEGLDRRYENYQKEVDLIMKEKGYDKSNWQTKKFESADHSENAWSKRLVIPLEFVLKF